MYKFVAETMDYFFRYAYIVSFLIYLCNRLSILYDLMWLYGLSIALFIASFFVYVYFMIKSRMYDNEWTFRITLNHYMKFRCIFPKRRFKLMKKDDLKKLQNDKKKNKRQ